MKNFDDFIVSLSEDDIIRICNEANEKSASMDTLGNKIGVINFGICLGLLQKYHEWLSK